MHLLLGICLLLDYNARNNVQESAIFQTFHSLSKQNCI